MRIFEVIYEEGDKLIVFANNRADVWFKHPIAWRVFEVIIK
jgi:hypothetical protein